MRLKYLLGGHKMVLSQFKYSISVNLLFIRVLTNLVLDQELLDHLNIIDNIDQLLNITNN